MLSQEKIQELEAKYDSILVLRGKANSDGKPRFEIALRKPKRAEYKMFRAAASKGDPDAQENLIVALVVSHTREEFMSLLDREPACADSCGNAVAKWIGLDAAEEGKE